MIRVVLESSPSYVKELRRLLYEVLPKKHGKVRFQYKKLNGQIRGACAEYHPYRVTGRSKRAFDIITYFDSDRRNFRCFHEDQLLDKWPTWSKN